MQTLSPATLTVGFRIDLVNDCNNGTPGIYQTDLMIPKGANAYITLYRVEQTVDTIPAGTAPITFGTASAPAAFAAIPFLPVTVGQLTGYASAISNNEYVTVTLLGPDPIISGIVSVYITYILDRV